MNLMMYTRYISFVCALLCGASLLSVFSCNGKKSLVPSYADLDTNFLQSSLAELSRDYYEGRMPFTRGEDRTVDYLTKQLQRMDILPGNNGSYVQDVPMVEITTYPDTTLRIETSDGGILSLEEGEDYIFHSDRVVDEVNILDSELVFCGYGIVDESRDWNDYAGIDMTGKTAVILINDPGYGSEDETFFNGDIMTYYGRWTYKYEEADRQGADGLIIIHETSSAGYPWFVIQSSWTGAMLNLHQPDNKYITGMKGWITLDSAKDLFTQCGLDLSAQIKAARKPGFTPVPMDAMYSFALKNELKDDESKNVIGVIEGKTKPNEYILYTAHWDHLGIGQPEEGDSIYNGALDNASGTATVLSIAEALTRDTRGPDRSVVFLFVTAEEQGLWGSAYYAENPIFPLSQTVCNINKDGVNPIGRMKDFTITGLGHSTMDDIAKQEALKQDRYIIGDQEPEKGFFYRSDHFNFAKKGVPVLYGKGGYEHYTKGVEYVSQFKKITSPRDIIDQVMNTIRKIGIWKV